MDVRAENRGRLHQKLAFSFGPGGGETLFDPWASGRKRPECPLEIRIKKFMVFFPDFCFAQTPPRPPPPLPPPLLPPLPCPRTQKVEIFFRSGQDLQVGPFLEIRTKP